MKPPPFDNPCCGAIRMKDLVHYTSKAFHLPIFLLSIGIAFPQADCTRYSKDYVPINLNDALDYLDCVWVDKETFKSKKEKDAVADAHFAGGQWIRNSWRLMDQKGSLYRELKSLGITFPEDVSMIILTSFHRHLNGREINLKGQLSEYKEYKRQREVNDKERSKLARQLKIGDTVSVAFARYPSTKDSYRLVVFNYGALVNRPTNCLVEGMVQEKKKAKGSSILTIQVTNTTNCDSSYYADKPMTTGQTFSYNVTYFNLRVSSKKNHDR